MNEGGWFLHGLVSSSRRRCLHLVGQGLHCWPHGHTGWATHVAWAFASGHLAVPCAGPSCGRILMGSVGGSGPLWDFPAPRLDGGVFDPLREPVLQSVPHVFRSSFCMAPALLFAMHGATILAVTRYGGDRETRTDRRPGNRVGTRGAVLALDDGLQRHRWNPFTAGHGGSRC